MALKRFVDGADGEAFFQKRAPKSVPEFVRTVDLAPTLAAIAGARSRASRWWPT